MGTSQDSAGSAKPRSGSDGIDGFTAGYVRKCARRLVGRFGFTRRDTDDIEQKLYLKLARYLPCNDPSDPKWKAFVALTVKRCIANIVRDRLAEKRDHRRVCSIHLVIGEDERDSVELADTIGEHENKTHRGWSGRSSQKLVELMLNTVACISEISDPTLREFCERKKTGFHRSSR